MRRYIYQLTSAAYSGSMLLFYLLHVFVFNRNDPAWLVDFHYINFCLPGIVSLKYLPLNIRENTYRHFLRTSYYILIAFNLFTMVTGENMICFKRIISALIMVGTFIAFLILIVYTTNNKKADL